MKTQHIDGPILGGPLFIRYANESTRRLITEFLLPGFRSGYCLHLLLSAFVERKRRNTLTEEAFG